MRTGEPGAPATSSPPSKPGTPRVGLTTTVTDTVTGVQRIYTNPVGTAALPVQDTAALPCS